MNEKPLISIIVPCYNQGRFLRQALTSILEQTYPHWECIIINDGSTDPQTAETALSFAAVDRRFYYKTQINSGVSAARNAALAISKGDYIRFLDADDWIEPRAFELSLLHVKDRRIVFSQVQSFLQEKQSVEQYYYWLTAEDLTFDKVLMDFGERFDIPIHCAMIPAALLKDFKFHTGLQVGEDWVMWLHIFRQEPPVFILDDALAWYRKWPESTTFQIHKSLRSQFWAIQFVISYFDIDEYRAAKLNERMLDKLFQKIETAERSEKFTRDSTSYKIGYLLVRKLSLINRFFNGLVSAIRNKR
jgi:glycosyltransferase involved in cell wall biosynthesis